MSKTIELTKHISLDELNLILRTSKDEAQKLRVKIILKIMSGKTRREISELLTVNVDTITDIVKRLALLQETKNPHLC